MTASAKAFAERHAIRSENLGRLTSAYWRVVAIGAVFTLARFSEAFLVVRAHQIALPVAYAPLVLIGMNLVYALSAYPFGRLSDSVSHAKLLAFGLLPLLASATAGLLWDPLGAPATSLAGAGFSLAALTALLLREAIRAHKTEWPARHEE